MGGINSRGDSQDNFTASQWTSLELLITALELSFYNTAEVKGHRDFPGVTKACPSFDVGRWYRDTFENPNDLV